jgi:VCBS repeat-containing protein
MATTLTNGLLNTIELTPNAKDDSFTAASTGLTEDSNGIVWLAVMANDLGGAAKILYSLDNASSTGGTRPTDLLTQDTVRTEALSLDSSLNGARIWITSDGRVGYDAATLSAAFRTQLQHLNPGQYLTDTFTYAIRMSDGALSWATATVQIAGVNDAPVVTGAVTSNAIEDGSTVTVDALSNASDVDSGSTLSVVNVPATLPAGVSYSAAIHAFTLNPANADYQYLATGQTTTVTVNYGVTAGFGDLHHHRHERRGDDNEQRTKRSRRRGRRHYAVPDRFANGFRHDQLHGCRSGRRPYRLVPTQSDRAGNVCACAGQ